MLRSLDYATAVVSSTLDVQAVAESRAWLRSWGQTARQAFLDAYRASARSAPIPLLPTEDVAFHQAVAALEADKAYYEVRYELSSRPDWAWVPLEALVSRVSPKP
jgi:predicted trehalose synthase